LGLKRKRNRAQSSEALFLGTQSTSQGSFKTKQRDKNSGPAHWGTAEAWEGLNCLVSSKPAEVSNLDLSLVSTLRWQRHSPYGAVQATRSLGQGLWKDEKSLKLMNSLFSNCSLIGSLTLWEQR